MRKYGKYLSFAISIDGNKELHDKCRVLADGSGSYDLAMKAVRHYVDELGGTIGCKMTISPDNITYLYDAVLSLIDNGYVQKYNDVSISCTTPGNITIRNEKGNIFIDTDRKRATCFVRKR